MLIQAGETTLLNAKSVISVLIKIEHKLEKVKKVKKFLGLFTDHEIVKKDFYILEVQYICAYKLVSREFSCGSYDYKFIEAKAKRVIEDIKKYDSSYIDRAFEETVLKE